MSTGGRGVPEPGEGGHGCGGGTAVPCVKPPSPSLSPPPNLRDKAGEVEANVGSQDVSVKVSVSGCTHLNTRVCNTCAYGPHMAPHVCTWPLHTPAWCVWSSRDSVCVHDPHTLQHACLWPSYALTRVYVALT